MTIRIGTRKSLLAMKQAEMVQQELVRNFPELIVEIIGIETCGDLIVDKPLYDIGGKGLFIKKIEEALLDNMIDIAVHSAKDVPSFTADGLDIPCVLKRGSARDVFISPKYEGIKFLPKAARVGSSSVRRAVQILSFRSDLEIVPLRGNIDTRISKVHSGEYDGIILAEAGIDRICRKEVITEVLGSEIMLGAVGQGAICVQCRNDDRRVLPILRLINDHKSFMTVLAERSFMKAVNGSCDTPLAAMAKYIGPELMSMKCMLADSHKCMVFEEKIFLEEDAEVTGFEVGESLKKELQRCKRQK